MSADARANKNEKSLKSQLLYEVERGWDVLTCLGTLVEKLETQGKQPLDYSKLYVPAESSNVDVPKCDESVEQTKSVIPLASTPSIELPQTARTTDVQFETYNALAVETLKAQYEESNHKFTLELQATGTQLESVKTQLEVTNTQLDSVKTQLDSSQKDLNYFQRAYQTQCARVETLEATRQSTIDLREKLHGLEMKELQWKQDKEDALREAIQAESVKSQTRISELAQEKAEAKGRNATLVLEMQTLQARYNSLELALAESNALVAKQHITLHPAAQGTEGEKETEQFLSQALGCMMRVENVSKIGQGKLMDLKLVTRDDEITICLDCKNYLGHLLPEKEIHRFNKDLDEMQPPAQACILFSKPPTKGNELINKSKRGNTLRYHVGSWSFAALLEAIHDAIIHTRLMRLHERDQAARLVVPGAPEVTNVFAKMMDMIRSDQQDMETLSEKTRVSKAKVAAYYRDILTALQQAHSANPQMVPQHLLVNFESQIPKQARGRPPTIKEPTDSKDKGKRKRSEVPKVEKKKLQVKLETKAPIKSEAPAEAVGPAQVTATETLRAATNNPELEPPAKKTKYTLGTGGPDISSFFASFKSNTEKKN